MPPEKMLYLKSVRSPAVHPSYLACYLEEKKKKRKINVDSLRAVPGNKENKIIGKNNRISEEMNCACTRNGRVPQPHSCIRGIDERRRLISRQRPTGCTGSPGILRYPDERFILSSLHSRHLLRRRPSNIRASSLPLSLRLCVSLSLFYDLLPLDPPSWSSAVHSGKQGSTSVPRWFSVHTRIPGEGCAPCLPRPPCRAQMVTLVHAWMSSY